MTPLTEEQVQALRELIGLWKPEGFVLVGASALGCFFELRWRKTQDLDLAVLIPLEDYPGGLETLPGWQPDSRLEHRWHTPGNVAVDFIPIGGEATDDTEIVWPRSGFRMSIVGLRLASDNARQLELATDVRIRVAPPVAIAILKMVAYLDRPHEREKDLEDLAHLLTEYLPLDDDRRFSNAVVDLQLEYEEVSAYHLGRDIAEIAGTQEFEAVSRFVCRTLDHDDPAATLAKMARTGPMSWQDDPGVLLGRLRALERGLRSDRRTK